MSTLPITPVTVDPVHAGVIVNILKRDYARAVANRQQALRDSDVSKHEFHAGESMTLAGVLGMLGQSLPEVPTYDEFVAANS